MISSTLKYRLDQKKVIVMIGILLELRKCAKVTTSFNNALHGLRTILDLSLSMIIKYGSQREKMKDDMEAMIHHFKLYTEGYTTPQAKYTQLQTS